MRHLLRRSSATLGTLALVAVGAVAGAQSASAAGPSDTVTTLTVPATVTAGRALTGSVTVDGLSTVVTAPVVELSVDGGASSEVPLTLDLPESGRGPGVATISVPTGGLTVGDHTLTATFPDTTPIPTHTFTASHDTATFTVLPASIPWRLQYADGSKVGSTLTQAVVHAVGSGQDAGASVSFMAGFDGEGEQLARGTVAADGTFDVSADVVEQAVVFPGELTDFWVVVGPDGLAGATSAVQTAAGPLLSFKVDLDTPAKPERGVARVSFTASLALMWLDQVDDDPADMVRADDLAAGLEQEAVSLLVDGTPVDPKTIELTDGAAGVIEGTFPAPAVGKHTAQLVLPGIDEVFGDSASPVRTFTIRPRLLTPVVHHDGAVHPGDSITVTGTGVQPGASVTIVLHSAPVTLATVKANAQGAFSANVRIPASTPVGAHTVVATATAAGTADVTGSTPLTVVAAPVVTDPVVTDPVVTDPVVTDPVVTDPVVTDPVVTNPGGELAATGSSDAPLGWLAGALVLAGAGAVLLARRATRA